jgi:hypothetical protein
VDQVLITVDLAAKLLSGLVFNRRMEPVGFTVDFLALELLLVIVVALLASAVQVASIMVLVVRRTSVPTPENHQSSLIM